MGLEPSLARAAIRVSLGWSTSEDDIEAFIAVWSKVALRRTARAAAEAA
jgi:cysteine desulfurase